MSAADSSAPDDHFTAGPHCCGPDSASGRVGRAGGRPTVRAGIVSPAGVQTGRCHPPQTIISLPVHTAVCPVRAEGALVVLVAVQLSVLGSYLPAGVKIAVMPVISAPDDHFAVGPHCRVTDRASGALVVLVAIQLSVMGLYLPPVFKTGCHPSAPDDHFTAGPHCCVSVGLRARWSCWWRSNCRCWGYIFRRYSKPLSKRAAPHDHFAAGPYCCVTASARGRVGGAGGCPTIGAGIISARRC